MEEHHDNPIYGRKVFFLNPQYSIQKGVISRLQEMEYEVYVIDDYRDAKNILRHFKDSICFINTDGQLTAEAWFNFVLSFQNDDSLKSIFLGVMSEHMVKADREQFLLKANIPAGLIMLNGSIEDITDTFQGILEINGAKGRRQYVRSQCAEDKEAKILYTTDGKMYTFKLLDISSVGVAAILPLQQQSLLQVNSVLRDSTLCIGKKQLTVTTAVYAIKPTDTYATLILLFMKGTSCTTKTAIREYVNTTLQTKMYDTIIGLEKDKTNYNVKPASKKQPDENAGAFLLEVDPTETSEGCSLHVPPEFNGKPQDLTITDLF